ncbi:MAG: RlmE family RNA methyltransferase [Candidatus Marsarchaeota archaeon]|nr:RlmE family RNA methyltransferase [Candidatus Marsarchaeota archaeon]
MNELSEWMRRHGGDRYYRLAKSAGHASRAYYKLEELDRRYRFIKAGDRILDLGSAPGGWVGYELEKVSENGLVVAVDVEELKVHGARNLLAVRADVAALGVDQLMKLSQTGFDVVLSDLAPKFTGVADVDMERHYSLVESALNLSICVLKPGGWFVVKLFQSSLFQPTVKTLRRSFRRVWITKPSSSRSSSSEVYAVCRGPTPKSPWKPGSASTPNPAAGPTDPAKGGDWEGGR